MTTSPFVAFVACGVIPRVTLVGFAVVLGVTTVMVGMDLASVKSALMMLLFLQMFASATGFWVHARRGYFDPVLVGHSRARVAIDHWLVSAAPGLCAWLIIGMVEIAWHRSWPVAWSVRCLVALFTVSCAAWAMTIPGPAGTGGVAWIMAMATLLTTRTGFEMVVRMRLLTGGETMGEMMRGGVVAVACPFLLLDDRQPPPMVLLECAVTAALFLAVGVMAVVRRDYALER